MYERGCLQPARNRIGDPMSVLDDMTGWLAAQPAGHRRHLRELSGHRRYRTKAGRTSRGVLRGFQCGGCQCHRRGRTGRSNSARRTPSRGNRLFHIRAGYDAVPNFLRERFERAGGFVLTGKRVTHVRWSRSGVGVCGRTPKVRLSNFRRSMR